MKLSLDQLHLCSVLAAETSSVISTSPRNARLSSDAVQKAHQTLPENPTTTSLHLDSDSGFESVESSIHTIVKRGTVCTSHISMFTIITHFLTYSFIKPNTHQTQNVGGSFH